MNIERTTTIQIAVHWKDLLAALKASNPGEFMLNQLPSEAKAVKLEALPGGIMVTYTKKSQGPAEIDFNRTQRKVEDE